MPHYEHGHFIIDGARVPYAIRRSKRRRRTINLIVGREGELRILAPLRTGFGPIAQLVDRQQQWIIRRLQDVEERKRTTAARRYTDGETILYRGVAHSLRITQDKSKAHGCAVNENVLEINLHDASTDTSARREEVRLELLLWYKKQARGIFEERAKIWSEKLRLRYRSFTVSNPKRLWGSCSWRNEVRVSWRLIMARPELLDYVIVHELCHIAQKNHSARFWKLVESAIPGCKDLRRELRSLSAALSL